MSSLISIEGTHIGKRFALREKFRIGRATDNDLILKDHLVSRYHAEILRTDKGFQIRDLGSKNGFQLNGSAATEGQLNQGDHLRIGQTVLAFETPKEVQGARFSDTLIHLRNDVESPAKFYGHHHLPTTPENIPMELIDRVSDLFDSVGNDLPEVLNAVVDSILKIFQAGKGTLILRSTTDEATPLVAIADQGEIYLDDRLIHRLMSKGQPVVTSALRNTDTGIEHLPRRAMLIPLVQRERVFGIFHIERAGEPDFKPTDLALLHSLGRIISGVVQHVIQRDQMMLATPERPENTIIGSSMAIEDIRLKVQRAAQSDATVLLMGETGSGKELIANAIHTTSKRSGAPFIAINCAAIHPNLIESELFGHEAGSFTGADRLKRGKVEMAEGGTLFLDEIGEMQIELQPKLLRFIEELNFTRVGGLHPIQTDVRIIAATNRNLAQAIKDGRFREDLLYRLNVLPFILPPLRERKEDIRPLVDHFAPILSAQLGKPYHGLLEDTWPALEQYTWPGNVRELRHALERAIILSDDGILRTEHFQINPLLQLESGGSATNHGSGSSTRHQSQTRQEFAVPPPLYVAEIEAIKRALRYVGGNRVKAAQILKIHRNTLTKKIQDYHIDI